MLVKLRRIQAAMVQMRQLRKTALADHQYGRRTRITVLLSKELPFGHHLLLEQTSRVDIRSKGQEVVVLLSRETSMARHRCI